MQATWGSARDVEELNRLFDALREFCERNDIPAYIGEFAPTPKKESASRVRWMSAVAGAAISRKMVPVLWETGADISRQPPFAPSSALREVLQNLP
jgi:endoglucanase